MRHDDLPCFASETILGWRQRQVCSIVDVSMSDQGRRTTLEVLYRGRIMPVSDASPEGRTIHLDAEMGQLRRLAEFREIYLEISVSASSVCENLSLTPEMSTLFRERQKCWFRPRLDGGPGGTRTPNQAVMSRRL